MDGDLGDQIIASSVSDVTFASELDGLAARLSENGGLPFLPLYEHSKRWFRLAIGELNATKVTESSAFAVTLSALNGRA